MPTIDEAVTTITETAKTVNTQEIRHIESMEISQVVRQGDVYLHRVKDKHKRGAIRTSRQLAPGVTMGSRHVAEGDVTIYEGTTDPPKTTRLEIGPVIVALDRFTVTHPEHAHYSLPSGTYQVTYQLDPRTNQRVQD